MATTRYDIQLTDTSIAGLKEAQAALTGLLADKQRGTFVAPDKVTLGEYLLEEWLPARRTSLRGSTAAAYEQMIRNYVSPLLGRMRLQEIDGAMLNRLYAQLLTEGRTETRRNLGPGLAPKTVRNVHGVLTRAFRDGVRWGRLQRNPCDAADPPRGQAPEMKAWTATQLRQFTKYTATHRWAGIWALMATTGMRRGEVLGLRWTDVDLDAGTVTIRSTRIRFGDTIATSTPKTARGNRTIAIGPATVAALKGWKRVQSSDRMRMGPAWQGVTGLVVTVADGSAANPEAFSNLFHKLSSAAGLPRIRLHDLRHSYATAALAAGVPVKVLSQRIGHADVGVTLKVYAHVLPGDDEDARRPPGSAYVETVVGERSSRRESPPCEVADLVVEHFAEVHRFLSRLTGGDRELTEDLVQSVFVTLVERADHASIEGLGVGLADHGRAEPGSIDRRRQQS